MPQISRTGLRASHTLKQQFTLAGVARERGGALKLLARFFETPEFYEQIAAHARQEMIILEDRLRGERVDHLKSRLGTEGHRDRYGAIQFHNRRWGKLAECLVEFYDARPVSFLGRSGARVTSGDRRL